MFTVADADQPSTIDLPDSKQDFIALCWALYALFVYYYVLPQMEHHIDMPLAP
jgi:hypothetical protein